MVRWRIQHGQSGSSLDAMYFFISREPVSHHQYMQRTQASSGNDLLPGMAAGRWTGQERTKSFIKAFAQSLAVSRVEADAGNTAPLWSSWSHRPGTPNPLKAMSSLPSCCLRDLRSGNRTASKHLLPTLFAFSLSCGLRGSAPNKPVFLWRFLCVFICKSVIFLPILGSKHPQLFAALPCPVWCWQCVRFSLLYLTRIVTSLSRCERGQLACSPSHEFNLFLI